jgi:hypothetical protein
MHFHYELLKDEPLFRYVRESLFRENEYMVGSDMATKNNMYEMTGSNIGAKNNMCEDINEQ